MSPCARVATSTLEALSAQLFQNCSIASVSLSSVAAIAQQTRNVRAPTHPLENAHASSGGKVMALQVIVSSSCRTVADQLSNSSGRRAFASVTTIGLQNAAL